jgi:hypothetical protein
LIDTLLKAARAQGKDLTAVNQRVKWPGPQQLSLIERKVKIEGHLQ